MIGLTDFIEEHRGAVERDLLTETGYELEDIGSTLSWGALKSYLSTIKLGSVLAEELNPGMNEWSTRARTNTILADIFDQLSLVNTNLRILITKKPGRRPEPYKRPGQERENTKHIGNGALPLSKMREWIENRRKEVVKRGDD